MVSSSILKQAGPQRFITLAVVVAAVCGICIAFWHYLEKPKPEQQMEVRDPLSLQLDSPVLTVPPPELPADQVRQLRERYPYQSLKARLHYERQHANKEKTPATEPKLSKAAAERLHSSEISTGGRTLGSAPNSGAALRTKALAVLHSEHVQRFVQEDSNGYRRMARRALPLEEVVKLPEAKRLPFEEGALEYPDSTEAVKIALLPSDKPNPEAARRYPAPVRLQAFHQTSELDFLDPQTFGHAREHQSVAGFEPHRFRFQPQLHDPKMPPPAEDRWLLRRLELVSLLKHDEPCVYELDHLPRMDDLKEAPTRSLNAFEVEALEKLRQGEDLVAEATVNNIQMLGTLRAATQCLQCHDAQPGEMLGAFSYALQRATPLATK